MMRVMWWQTAATAAGRAPGPARAMRRAEAFGRPASTIHGMTWMVRVVVIALIGLMVSLAQRRGFDLLATKEDFIHIRDVPPEIAEATGLHALGYHYKVLGIYNLDLWRWGGEFVIYRTTLDPPITAAELTRGRVVLSSTTYAEVSELEGKFALDWFEGSVPWRYYFPPGLLIVLGVVEFALVGRRRRSVRTALAVGGALVVIALVMFVKDVGAAAAIPLALGIHHLGVAGLVLWKHRHEDAAEDEVAPEPQPDAARRAKPPRRERRPVSQVVSRDPYREPPQPAPIVANAPPRPATSPAMIIEGDAPAPKLLR